MCTEGLVCADAAVVAHLGCAHAEYEADAGGGAQGADLAPAYTLQQVDGGAPRPHHHQRHRGDGRPCAAQYLHPGTPVSGAQDKGEPPLAQLYCNVPFDSDCR